MLIIRATLAMPLFEEKHIIRIQEEKEQFRNYMCETDSKLQIVSKTPK